MAHTCTNSFYYNILGSLSGIFSLAIKTIVTARKVIFKLKTEKELTKREEDVGAFQAQEPALRKYWRKKNLSVFREKVEASVGATG